MNLFKDIPDTTATINNDRQIKFTYLPECAGYLLSHKIREMALRQYQLSKELKIPILQYFSNLPEEEIIARGEQDIRRVLTALHENDIQNYIRLTVTSWVNNQIPEFSRNQLLSEDISLLSYIRRTVFREFVGAFTQDHVKVISVLEEMDRFLSLMDTAMFKTLFAIQQELHEQSQEIAHLGNWLWDLISNRIIWSRELFRIYELEPTDHLTFDISVYNHPDDANMVLEHMRISRETKRPHDFYYRIIMPSGSEKHLHARGQVILNEAGDVERMYGTLQDVTSQKENEKIHREYENFIQKVTDLTPSLITVYNIKTGQYLFLNQALNTLLGYNPNLAMTQGIEFFISIIHPEDLPRVLDENNTALKILNEAQGLPKSDQIREFRYRLRHSNGEYRWFHTYGTIFERDKNSDIEKLINISNDITEQVTSKSLLHQKTEEIVRQEERYYKTIDEVEDYAIFLLTKEGVIENWNKGAEKIKGYGAEEIVGRHVRVLYTPEDQNDNVPEKLITKAAETGKASNEGWRVRKNGSKFWAYVVITALHDRSGELIGFSKVTRDLTARKVAEENLNSYTRQLEDKNRQLQEKNKELESFAYIASHDLQEPLRKIKLWSNRLADSDPTPETVQSALTKIRTSTTRMQALIEGLLNYTQLDDIKSTTEIVDLTAVLHDVLDDFSERLEERQAVVTTDVLPSFPAVRLQMQQLFANLISNSVKYAQADKPLAIAVGYKLVAADFRSPGDYHQITFTDNGVGFSEEYSQKIFEIFQRLDNSRNSGTGIGLAICKKIVENHGGTITASSEPGSGATFYILLPSKR